MSVELVELDSELSSRAPTGKWTLQSRDYGREIRDESDLDNYRAVDTFALSQYLSSEFVVELPREQFVLTKAEYLGKTWTPEKCSPGSQTSVPEVLITSLRPKSLRATVSIMESELIRAIADNRGLTVTPNFKFQAVAKDSATLKSGFQNMAAAEESLAQIVYSEVSRLLNPQ